MIHERKRDESHSYPGLYSGPDAGGFTFFRSAAILPATTNLHSAGPERLWPRILLLQRLRVALWAELLPASALRAVPGNAQGTARTTGTTWKARTKSSGRVSRRARGPRCAR